MYWLNKQVQVGYSYLYLIIYTNCCQFIYLSWQRKFLLYISILIIYNIISIELVLCVGAEDMTSDSDSSESESDNGMDIDPNQNESGAPSTPTKKEVDLNDHHTWWSYDATGAPRQEMKPTPRTPMSTGFYERLLEEYGGNLSSGALAASEGKAWSGETTSSMATTSSSNAASYYTTPAYSSAFQQILETPDSIAGELPDGKPLAPLVEPENVYNPFARRHLFANSSLMVNERSGTDGADNPLLRDDSKPRTDFMQLEEQKAKASEAAKKDKDEAYYEALKKLRAQQERSEALSHVRPQPKMQEPSDLMNISNSQPPKTV